MAAQLIEPWSVSITRPMWEALRSHLFPGDYDEHAAVVRCGISSSSRGTRLLVHDVVLARDGIDYVPGDRGYRKLVPEFVLETAESCANDGLVYLAIHCHGGSDEVEFSETDLQSHSRGYPALLDITTLPAVGALVFAEDAVAGDIWLTTGQRVRIDQMRIVGRPEERLSPSRRTPVSAAPGFDRQARVFGDRGQALIAGLRIAIIGLGGAGSLVNEYLARLGVGELVLIDPDRVETSNLSRIVGASRRDAWPWLTDEGRPAWIQRLGAKLSRSKVAVAKRVAEQASDNTRVIAIRRDANLSSVAEVLTTVDHIFLAADSDSVRLLVNAITHQYLIPNTQVGAKVSIVEESGAISDIFSVSRMSMPGSGCLQCNLLISSTRLQEEAKSSMERRLQRYVDGEAIPNPSVITLNTVAAAQAVNDWLMSVTGLTEPGVDADRWILFHPLTDEVDVFEPRKRPSCRSCGSDRFARGDSRELPVKAG